MYKFQFEILFHIIGIGASSGLFLNNKILYVIADNSTYLYQYNLKDSLLSKIKLQDNSRENIIKSEKADLEAITKINNKYYIFGSGSTAKRNSLLIYNSTDKTTTKKDLTTLYTNLGKTFNINHDNINIEGVVNYSNNWFFFQRGNGNQSKNGIFSFKGELENPSNLEFITIDLPKVNNVSATFTDAVLVKNKIYFLAAIEDSKSTYKDGAILGSYIGCFNTKTKTIEFIEKISDTKKLEGLTVFKSNNKEIIFWLCEDKDDNEDLTSTIYQLKIIKTT